MTHTSRKTFGQLFQSVYKIGIGVEVGSEQGYNAVNICEHWQGKLVCVDIWKDGKGFLNDFKRNTFGKDITFKVCDSVTGASEFEDESLDFVYIDDDHSYNGVKRSFEAWFPKVRKGGIVSFHDYAPITHKNDCDGVRQFLDELIASNSDIEMNFTTDDFYTGDREDLKGFEYQSAWFIKE